MTKDPQRIWIRLSAPHDRECQVSLRVGDSVFAMRCLESVNRSVPENSVHHASRDDELFVMGFNPKSKYPIVVRKGKDHPMFSVNQNDIFGFFEDDRILNGPDYVDPPEDLEELEEAHGY